MTARRRGRPSRLTPAVAEAIVSAVQRGFPIEVAASMVRVRKALVLGWVRRGEEEDAEAPYADFALRYRKARAEFFGFLMRPCIEAIAGVRPSKREKGKLVKALDAPTRANEARYHLGRRFPEFYGHGRESREHIAASAEAVEATAPPVIKIIYAADDDATAGTNAEPAMIRG